MKLPFITFALVTICSTLQAAERVPGTKVSIEPPAGFEVMEQYPGFSMESTGSSIIVTELPAPIGEFSSGFTKKALAARGVGLLEQSEVKIASGDAHLFKVAQAANGIDYLKWMVVFGNGSEPVMILAAFPADFEKEMSEKLKRTILAATWDLEVKVDPDEGMTFNVQESGDLKIARKAGNAIALTRNGVIPPANASEPLLIVAPSFAVDWTEQGDKAKYVRQRLVEAKELTGVEVTFEKAVEVDGLSGYLMEANAKDSKTGTSQYVLQCMLFTSDGYYLLQGFVGAGEKDAYSNVFLKILTTFKRVK
ncbi:MAG: hypothetical protein HYV27_25075 [Candidatus Hydrogenedentes bacterium]|nr:hypothetical protein [Candidatus Hydrogenedentota bacterium]